LFVRPGILIVEVFSNCFSWTILKLWIVIITQLLEEFSEIIWKEQFCWSI